MFENIIENFILNVKKEPNKIALIFEEQSFSYSQLANKVVILSDYLMQNGVKKGDHVGVLLPNCPEFVVLMLAASHLGITLVPQNMTFPAKSIVKSFETTDVKHIVGWHTLIPKLQKIKNNFLSWISIDDFCNNTIFYDIVENKQQLNLVSNNISSDQPYILTMTSGSTGDPKPIMLLQSTKILRVQSTIRNYDIAENDIILAATPLYHSLAQRLVLLPLLSGGTSILMAGFTSKEWIEKVKKYGVTFTMAVSSQLKQISSEMFKQDYQLDSLRCLVSSSELLEVKLKKALIQQFDCDFYECYGTSEVACVTNISDGEDDKNTSVGKPLPMVEIEILKDDGSIAENGEVGEIICKTPMVFSGYYKRPDMTENVLWNDYFCTGDLGMFDDEGYLYFKGRKKDIIITGGINVYPKDIETILNNNSKVIESSVIALPDDKLGEIVTAVVVLADKTVTIRELQRVCAEELADFQQPRKFILVDELPKNAMGKVLKHQLRSRYL